MTPFEVVVIVAIVAYALYRQARRHEVVGSTRFRMAVVYGAIGVVVGGYHLPPTTGALVGLVVSLVLSMVVGLARGRLTRLWVDGGRVYAQGTALSIALFLALFVAKLAYGTVAYLSGGGDSSNFGDILVMIALMVAFQAEIVWRRARPMGARTSDHDSRVTA